MKAQLNQLISITVLALCIVGCGGGDRTSHSRPSTSEYQRQAAQNQSAARRAASSREMVRQVNAIVSELDGAEALIRERLIMIEEERQLMDQLKSDSREAYIAGLVSDYRTWQRIARDKQANIENGLARIENTISLVRNDTNSRLRQVSWSSASDRRRHQARIEQRLGEVLRLEQQLSSVRQDLGAHQRWLEATL